jgi:hypothetical protein
MGKNKAELKAKLERTLRRKIPRVTWDRLSGFGGAVEQYYEGSLELDGGEEDDFRALKGIFAEELKYLERYEQEKAGVAVEVHETQAAGDALSAQKRDAELRYFDVELGDYEKERQRAFAEAVAREANRDEEVVSFRRDYLGVNTLTPDQAYSFLESPAAGYFMADLFLNLQVSAARHRAEIVGQYERVRDAFNDVDHRVTVRVDPPGITQRVRYARRESPVTDGDQIDIRHCVFKDSEGAVMKTPDEVLLRYRGREGAREVAHIWPDSVLDELRRRSSMLANIYGWKEEDMVWFFLTGEAPRLSTLTLNVRLTAGKLTTITMTAAPWVSAETIKKNYQKVQRQVLVKGNHALSLRSIAVLRFVERNIREKGKLPRWTGLLDRWNQEHPEWKYQSYRGLRQTYYRALDAVVYAPARLPKANLTPALEEKAREEIEHAKEIAELARKRGDNKQTKRR